MAKISYPTNIEPVKQNSLVPRDVDKYFNNWFDIPIEVSSNVDSAVIAYFEQITINKESARALASAVLYTSVKNIFRNHSFL